MNLSTLNKKQKSKFEEVLKTNYSNSLKAEKLLVLAQNIKLESCNTIEIVEEFETKDILNKIDLQLQLYRRVPNYKASLELANKYEALVKNKANYLEYAIDIALHKIFIYFNQGEKEKSVNVGDEILKKAKNNTKKEVEIKLIEIYRCTGGIATASGDYKKCMSYYKEGIRLCKKHGEFHSLVVTYTALGDIYRSQFEPEKALGYLMLALEISKRENFNTILPKTLRNIGLCHSHMNEDVKAEKFLKEALAQSELNQDYRMLPMCLMSLGDFYIKLGKVDAFFNIEKKIKTLSLYKNDINFKNDVLFQKSEAYFIKGKYEKALLIAKEVEKICVQQNGFIDLKKAYELNLKIYKELKDFKKALEYFEKLYDLDKKILNKNAKKSLNEFEAKFQNEKKEKEIQALKLESVSFQLQSLRAQMNPHFVFNSIASISSSLEPETIENSKTLLHSFARLMRSNLEFAELEKINLEDEIQFLKDYLSLEKNRLGEKLSFEINYSEDLDIDFIEIPSMVIQPYIENAIKHGITNSKNNGFIKISFEEKLDFLICKIEDNGIGRKTAEKIAQKTKKHLGRSTTINAKRLDLINKSDKHSVYVTYKDLKNEKKLALGTEVVLKIRID